MSIFDELKRRNVFRVGAAYAVIAWLLLQVADIVIDNISAPLLLLQGLDDKVVPADQAEGIRNKLLEKGVDVGYITFEGEGHGFRQLKNQVLALNAELDFYGQVFGFTPAGDIERVELIDCSPTTPAQAKNVL